MAFPREVAVVPAEIWDIEISLFDPRPAGAESRKARVSVQVQMSNGATVSRNFNLVEHVEPDEVTWLIALVKKLRDKAEAEILPEASI